MLPAGRDGWPHHRRCCGCNIRRGGGPRHCAEARISHARWNPIVRPRRAGTDEAAPKGVPASQAQRFPALTRAPGRGARAMATGPRGIRRRGQGDVRADRATIRVRRDVFAPRRTLADRHLSNGARGPNFRTCGVCCAEQFFFCLRSRPVLPRDRTPGTPRQTQSRRRRRRMGRTRRVANLSRPTGVAAMSLAAGLLEVAQMPPLGLLRRGLLHRRGLQASPRPPRSRPCRHSARRCSGRQAPSAPSSIRQEIRQSSRPSAADLRGFSSRTAMAPRPFFNQGVCR